MTPIAKTQAEHDGTGVARLVALAMVPIAPLTTLVTGAPLLPALLASVLFGAVALLSRRFETRLQPILLALALIGQCGAFTAAFAGHPWQIDSHMTYFAMLAIVATLGSIPALVFAVALVSVHHLVLGTLVTALVFPAADVGELMLRAVFHAAIVVFESAVLVWYMIRSARAAADITAARALLEQSAGLAATAQVNAEAARERAVAVAGLTRSEGQRAAAAVEQIAATAKSATASAAHAQTVATRAKADAELSSEIVHKAMAAMNGIEESSSQIGSIVKVIDEIARQTDLLALNAAIESARAGDAGRGFAVVATEVRALAMRSADATQQIRDLVSTSSGQVIEGVALVSESGRALARIVTAVSDLNDLVSGIAQGASEQAAGLAQVNVAIARIDSIADEDNAQRSAAAGPVARSQRRRGAA